MINATKARSITDSAKTKACNLRVFKNAISNLEQAIKEAASKGKSKICFNVAYFDICSCSSLQNDIYATKADCEAIRDYMVKNGYEFFFHDVMNIAGRFNCCFTCRW